MTKPDTKQSKKTKLTASEQQAVLRNLNQQSAAWLLGKSTTWLRDNNHHFDRSPDGSYDARNLLTFVETEATDNAGVGPTDLSGEHYEVLLQWLYSVTHFEGRLSGCLRVIREIEEEHGSAGLAAVGQVVKQIGKEHLQYFPEHKYRKTPESIRADGLAKIEQEIENIDRDNAQIDMRFLLICEKCGKYRLGRNWHQPPLPAGYYENLLSMCPKCETK